jgi:hypothetical protein
LGGLTTTIHDPSTFVLNVRPVVTPEGNTFFVANDVMSSSDTFFTFSYGGGLKAQRLWGPLGAFADIHGRSVPNFFTSSIGWPELTGGLTFSWGEK